MRVVGYRCEKRIKRSRSRFDSVRRARYRVKPLQMASLSWRHHSLVRAVVPQVPDLICAYGRDGARTRSAHPLQLHLALGSKSTGRNWTSAAVLT
jgi:hypothetical protein